MNTFKNSALALCAAAGLTTMSFTAALAANSAPSAPGSTAAEDVALKDAAKKSPPLQVISNVSDAASIQAVLIPASLARRIFGKEVSNNYAVVEVIISNQDANAALVVHSLFLDDSKWLLRGGESDCKHDQTEGLLPTQRANQPCQIASIESRLVRGELLDAQQWTLRNWTMRSLVALGSAGAAFEFPFSPDVVKGISAFNGVIVPGASTLWPDGTVSQINRISDVGFQTNKVIPKQTSDIMVAFFPISRFLTPSFRSIFLKDPAALFVPIEMVADPKTAPQIEEFLKPLSDLVPPVAPSGDSTTDKQKKAVTKAFRTKLLLAALATCKPEDQLVTNNPKSLNACQLQSVLSGLSLNNVRVVVEGAMTVDVGTVPASVYSFELDNDADKIWTTTTDQTGTITGIYLTGGVPSIVDENGKPIKDVSIAAVADGSNDTELKFKLTVKKCVASPTKAFVQVSKTPDAASDASASSTASS